MSFDFIFSKDGIQPESEKFNEIKYRDPSIQRDKATFQNTLSKRDTLELGRELQ